MLKYIRGCALFFVIALAFSFAIGFSTAWLPGLDFVLLLIGMVLVGLFLLGSLICLGLGIRTALRASTTRDRILAVLAAPVMMGLSVLGAAPSLQAGESSGTWTCLMVNRSHYEAIIAREQQGHPAAFVDSSYQEDGGVKYVVDKGPPLRVAFNPDGLLDNWSAIVFDPTGEVMQAKGFDPKTGKFAAPDCITKLFGGDLVECRHVWGSYYDCAFT